MKCNHYINITLKRVACSTQYQGAFPTQCTETNRPVQHLLDICFAILLMCEVPRLPSIASNIF